MPVCTNQPDTYCPPACSSELGKPVRAASLEIATHHPVGLTWAQKISSHSARGRPSPAAPAGPADHGSRVGAKVGAEHWVWEGRQRRLGAIQPHRGVGVEGVLVHAAHSVPFKVHGCSQGGMGTATDAGLTGCGASPGASPAEPANPRQQASCPIACMPASQPDGLPVPSGRGGTPVRLPPVSHNPHRR